MEERKEERDPSKVEAMMEQNENELGSKRHNRPQKKPKAAADERVLAQARKDILKKLNRKIAQE